MLNGRALVAQCCSSRAQWPATEYGIGVSSLVCFLEIPCIWRHVFIPFNMLQVPSTVFEHGQTTTGCLSWWLASKHIRERERLPLGSKITLKGDWIMMVCIGTPCCLGSSYTKEFKSFFEVEMPRTHQLCPYLTTPRPPSHSVYWFQVLQHIGRQTVCWVHQGILEVFTLPLLFRVEFARSPSDWG